MSEVKTKTPKDIVAVVTGIQTGEETKGAAVEWLTQELDAHTVIRNGGCQAGHHIVKEDGREQQFSHFGAGTFDGAKTYLRDMVIEPVQLFDEAMELEGKGIGNPLSIITIDGECISITPFHGALSRLKEIYREENKKGTIGMGVGDAVRDSQRRPHLTIRARDFLLGEDHLKTKIEQIRLAKLQEACEVVAAAPYWWYLDGAEKEFLILEDEKMATTVAASMIYLADLVAIVGEEYFDQLMENPGSIVTEPSHGALLHPFALPPHSTQVDPTSEKLIRELKERNSGKKIVRLGVGRCYHTRHGAGPLVSFDRELTNTFHETHNAANEWANEWLGEFRVGHYDLIAARYALEIAGGVDSFDGLMISYLDVLNSQEKWGVVEAYTFESEANDLDDFFEMEDDKIIGIKPYEPDTRDEVHLRRQMRLTELLKQCEPVVSYLRPTETQTLEEVFLSYVEEKLGVPVIAVSRGPKAEDREKRPAWARVFGIEEEPNKGISVSRPAGAGLFEVGSGKNIDLPQELANNDQLIEQARARREMEQSLRQMFDLCGDLSADETLKRGLITADQLADFYTQLTEFIQADENNIRLILYLPFEILPDLNIDYSDDETLTSARNTLVEVLRQGWLKLLYESEPRASFVDGDVLEPGMGEPERIRKAAHLIPDFLRRGLIDIEIILDLFDVEDDQELLSSLTDGLTAARGQELITDDNWRVFETKLVSSDHVSEAVDEAPISPSREAWVQNLAQEKRLVSDAQKLAEKLKSGETLIADLNHSQTIDLRALFMAIEETEFDDHDRALHLSVQSMDLIRQAWNIDSSSIRDEIIRGVNHLYKLGLLTKDFLNELGIVSIDLSLPDQEQKIGYEEMLVRASETIKNHPELSKFFYPFFLVFGSRIKGYGTSNADLDMAVMIRPKADFEQRDKMFELLFEQVPELKNVDKILEFWLETKEGKLNFRVQDERTATMVGAPQIHFVLGSIIIGDTQAANEVYQDLLPKYLDLSRFGEQEDSVRGHLLRQLELDILQYRLMHKGYSRFNPVKPRPSFEGSDLIDGDSDFWDPGYRRTASLLFASRVFLPNLD